eukprot:Seg1389.21 transcript_id=Seg1389.21/GoldUCD/mRNA.D3Y31 product="Melanocortin receptor 5" protein_id=Seg1389.21/GoldUCD/D3Y31
MANNSSNNGNGHCLSLQLKIPAVYLPAIILHLLIARVLISKLKLRKQMHKLLLSLSMADLIHMIVFTLSMFILNSKKPHFASATCQNAQAAAKFCFYSMMAASSGSIIGLSVERYIACIHCFQLHSIMTKKRTTASIAFIWCAGLIFGLVAVIQVADGNIQNEQPKNPDFVPLIYANSVLIFATSSILIFVQARLFVLIRRRIRRIRPGGESRASYQNRSFLQQVKINIAVCAVAVAYITCMLPVALTVHLRSSLGRFELIKAKKIALALLLSNPILEAFIYAIGIRDTWNGIASDFLALKRYLLSKIF